MNKVLKGHGHNFSKKLFCYFECTNKAFKMINRNDCQLLGFIQYKEFCDTRLCNVNKDCAMILFTYIKRPVWKLKSMCKTIGNENLCQKQTSR